MNTYITSQAQTHRLNKTTGVYTRAQWEARANQRIEFLPGTPVDDAAIFSRNEYITAAYADMYFRAPTVFTWAGMAALTSSAVGRGMYMMHYLRQSRLAGVVGLFNREAAEISRTLGMGNIAVFADIYWQHMAYDRGGLGELESIYRAGQLAPEAYEAWQQIDQGKRTNNQELIWQGNKGLLKFEQRVVLQPAVYDNNLPLWREVSGWISSPIPGHYETFGAFMPYGNLGIFEERWQWIEQSMLPRWRELAETQPQRVERILETRLIGGVPFALPGVPVTTLNQVVHRATGLGNGGAWLPKMPSIMRRSAAV